MGKGDIMQPIDTAIEWINKAGVFIESKKIKVQIRDKSDMGKVPEVPGVYWIETTMPERAIFDAKKFKEKRRKEPPKGTTIILQKEKNPYIIYNGTESNIRRRLSQHLFNEGNEGTGKRGLEIDTGKWREYEWNIYYMEIKDVPMRNAIEIWWRHHIG